MGQHQITGTEFLRADDGGVRVVVTDPAYVQSDMIVVERSTLSVFAIFHESEHFLGAISPGMADAFAGRDHVLLSARRGDGTMFEMPVPVSVQRKPQFGATASGWAQADVIRVSTQR